MEKATRTLLRSSTLDTNTSTNTPRSATPPGVTSLNLMHLTDAVLQARDAEHLRYDEALLGTSFLVTSMNSATGAVHLVPLKGAHTPDGISLKGHYWTSQYDNELENKTVTDLQNQYRNLKFTRKGGGPLEQKLTQSWKRATSYCCTPVHVSEENVQHKASQGSCRAACWLILEAPESGPRAYWMRNVRLLLTFMALMLVFLETDSSYNEYGLNTTACKATVNHYCNYISQCSKDGHLKKECTGHPLTTSEEYNQTEINRLNPACFKNETSGYGGCTGQMNGQYKECDFPNEKLGMVLDPSLFGVSFLEYLGKSDTSKLYITERMQCTAWNEGGSTSGGKDYSHEFWVIELIITLIFVIELISRLAVATAPDDLDWSDWFSDFGNWIDILAVCTALIELIGNSVDFQDSQYQVWGWMWNHNTDPGTFRFLRLVVAVRFMLQQRHFKDTQLITATIYQVANRLLVPIMLFALLVTMFGSLLYFVEGGVMYECEDFNSPTSATCKYCGGPPFVVPFGTGITTTQYSVDRYGEPTVTTGIVWSEPFLGHKEWYNGTCQFLHLAAAGSTTGIGAGRELMTPLIIDAYDGLWTMFIVMTTVGYGGKRPHTNPGKIVTIMAAIFGAFYLAMPLSIISTAFEKNYEVHVEIQLKEKQRRNRQGLLKEIKKSGGKLKFMHIVKLKLWAKRAKERAQGHFHHSDPPGSQVLKYANALHELANNHNHTQLMEFKAIHTDLLANCVTIMARHMKHA